MSNNQPARATGCMRTIGKLTLSGAVIISFIVYALFFASRFSGLSAVAPQQSGAVAQQPTPGSAGVAADTAPPLPPTIALFPTAAPTEQPATAPPATEPPAPTAPPALAAGQYRDGEYTGPVVDAYYGDVQIKAIIQGGKIADVQFLQYPNDRRTSIRINNIAMPYLKTEAIQVQSANVDIISGATLTSEAFAESLQAALDNAKASV